MNQNAIVLLVEDDTLLAESLGEKFKTEGFELLLAKSGEEGIAMAKSATPDIIVTDVTLPGMDGIEMAHEIRKEPITSAVPVIILSNNDDAANIAKAVAEDLTTYLIKSDHGLDSIIAVVKKTLAGAAQ